MHKILRINFRTIYKKCNEDSFCTGRLHNRNKAIITNVSEDILEILRSACDVIIDYAQKTITLMRNAQIVIPLKELGYKKDMVITFTGGRLIAVSQ